MEKVFSESNYDEKKEIKVRVAIVSFPWRSYSPYKFISDIIKILEPISKKIILISGNTKRIGINSRKVELHDIGISMHYLNEVKPLLYSAILWIMKCLETQIKASLELIKTRKDIDLVIFYMAYPYYLLPLIVSKILGKKTIEIVTRGRSHFSILSKILRFQDLLLFLLLDGISPESRRLINELDLGKYEKKLLPEGARFVDTHQYIIKKKLSIRRNKIGYISRLRPEKGIVNFVKAIPIVAKKRKDIEFLIGGDGDLLDWVKSECKKIENEYGITIKIVGFIKREKVADHLNELKLLVLPSESEGLPTIVLEAMACGTPVLATPVGAIPELIVDSYTGFLMENNSPKVIALNILRALENDDLLENVSKNAWKVVTSKYTYKKAVERYTRMIKQVIKNAQ